MRTHTHTHTHTDAPDPKSAPHKTPRRKLYILIACEESQAEREHPHPKCFVRASRGKYRSRTFPEVARAIARQWSAYILDDLAK